MDPAQLFHLENDPNFREPPIDQTKVSVACSGCGMHVWGMAEGQCPRCGGRLEEVTLLSDFVTLVAVRERGSVILPDRRILTRRPF